MVAPRTKSASVKTAQRSLKKSTASGAAENKAVESAFLLQDIDEKIEFLLQASDILSSSLEYQATLTSVANLVVPRLAEWCTIHVKEKDGSIQQLVLAHADPKMIDHAKELNTRYPPDYSAPHGVGEILRTGKPEFVPEITDAMLVAAAIDEEHLRIARNLRLGSYMSVPLTAREETIGVLTFCSVIGKFYTEADLVFAQSLASRAALAVDNARLYQESRQMYLQIQELNADLEKKVEERTEELRLSQEKDKSNLHRLKIMLAHLPMAALMMDEHSNVLELNEEYCRLFHIGLTAAEAMSLSPEQLNERFHRCLLHPGHHMEEVTEILQARKPKLAHDIFLKDGRIVQRDFLPIHDKERFLGQLFLYRDITRERRIDAAKSEFMSLASHQLRTPLTSMRWAMSMLTKGLYDKANDFERKLLQEGRDGITRMCETIDTMLHISRIESGEMKCSRTEISLQGFLQELMKNEQREFADKEQDVSVICPPQLSLRSDASLLKELLGNLLNNAMKYTPQKGSICLEATQEASTLLFIIQDSGYGIPRHQQAYLFKKFFRGDNVVDKVTKGTGLGLYLVSLLTGLLGGTIDFRSVEGRGTTFTLRFPLYGPDKG